MSKAKIFLASIVWLVILTIGVVLYRYWIVPERQEQAAQQQEEVLDATSGSSNYKHHLKIGLDGFSGYAILRSDAMKQQLRSRGIKAEFVDDGADYEKRIARLASGELQLAAFPIDALLRSSSQIGSLPATVVALIDETRGADALVAYKSQFPNIDSLNSPETRFVLVGNSPSETLVRVLMHDFELDNVTDRSFVALNNEKDLVARYKKATPPGHEVFVTWEPVVSELLLNDQMPVLVDSSKQSGYIVDALVVSRDYLIKNEPVVRQVIESYFRALYSYRERSKLETLLLRDAAAAGSSLTSAQAKRLVDGIVWKNTQENYAHFGLRSASVSHVEDMIDRIKRVLQETGGLSNDPTGGDSSRLFFERILSELQSAGFHPGMSPEAIRGETRLKALSDTAWDSLVPVGTLSVPSLIFARGTSRLTGRSKSILDELVGKLESWPQYYVMIRGNSGSRGDPEANRKLAKQRAEAALQYLESKGVAAERIRATEGDATGSMSVTFVLGQPPY